MSVDCPSRALVIDIEPKNQEGSLIIALPRGLLDSTYGDEDDSFFIIIDGEEVDATELDKNQEIRVIEIPIAKGSSNIEIISAFLVSQSDNPLKISPCGVGREKQSPYYQLLSPLQQFKAGYESDDIICKEGLELAIKREHRHHPICLKPDSLPILIQRGFAMEIQYAE